MRGARNIGKHEFIGLDVEILNSSDPSIQGLSGMIVDETKNTFVVDIDGREKRISKKIVRLGIRNTDIIVDGAKITYRPEDRIKKVRSW